MKEMRAAVKALGMEGKKDEVRKLIKEIDGDGSGTIDIDEFKTIFNRLKEGEEEDANESRRINMKVFKLIDIERTGKITYEMLRRVCLEIGENLNDEEIGNMLRWADKDGDGMLKMDEFVDALTPSTWTNGS